MRKIFALTFLTALMIVTWQNPAVSAGDHIAMQVASTPTSAQQEVRQAFQKWRQALSSGASKEITALYADESILLPTLSAVVHNTPAIRKKYFDTLTAKKSLKATVTEEHLRLFNDIAVVSGLYTFTYQEDGKEVSIPARYSFVFQKTPKGWMIVDHHSSKQP